MIIKNAAVTDKQNRIRSCELFRPLDSAQVARLAARCRKSTYATRQPICLPAEPADSIYLLEEGLVKVCHITPEGKQSILAFVGPGEPFGELAVLDRDRRDEYIESVESSSVLSVSAAEVRRLMGENADFAVALTTMIGIRRRRVERRLRNLLFLSYRDRLVHVFLDLAEQFGLADGDGIHLRIRLSHQELASLIGSTRETVTVLLGQLRTEGLIRMGRRRIYLSNPQRLAEHVRRRVVERPDPKNHNARRLATVA